MNFGQFRGFPSCPFSPALIETNPPEQCFTHGPGGRGYLDALTGYQSSLWITRPERSLGSNQVVFGGMMLPVSAMLMSWSMVTG